MHLRNWVRAMIAGVLLCGLLFACVKERQPEGPAAQPQGEESTSQVEAATRPETGSAAQPETESREPKQPPASPAGREGTVVASDPSYVPLAVYRFDPLNGHLFVTRTIEITRNVSRGEALGALLDRVNQTLSGRRIQWSGIDRTEQGDILVLDLVDAEGTSEGNSWYNSFQGSAGGAATQGSLTATFLQPAYSGDWYDGVRFLLNGEPMSEMDHVNLSGVFLRGKPMAENMIVSMSEPGDMSEEEISEYLRNMLELSEDAQINLARVRSGDGTPWVVFFTSSSIEMASRGVLRMVDGVPRILSFEQDPCYCFAVAAEPRDLVRGLGEFIVTRFSPLGGTCVASEVVRILELEENGDLVEVWWGTTFEADGPRSRVASVEFVDQDGDGDLEILRRGQLIDCGDDCLCREGPVLESFEALFEWSPEEGRFVAVP
jgi:hypothetical protein